MPSDLPSEVTITQRVRGVTGFLWRERWSFLLIAAVLFPVAAWIFDLHNQWRNWETWNKILTVYTLATGLAVFFSESIEDWEDRLSRRLTVFFQFERTTCLVCYQAHLPHEGDIRHWSQQIGRQVFGDMKFSPYPEIRRLGIERQGDETFLHFQAVFFLKELPPGQNESLKGKCIVLRAGEDGLEIQSFESPSAHVPRAL